MKDTKTTNTLLLIIVVPFVFYLLKTLSFIFIPLVLSMFIALLFLPLMRWLDKKRIPKVISIVIVICIIAVVLKIGGALVELTSHEIMSTKTEFLDKAKIKISNLVVSVEAFFGIERLSDESIFDHYLKENNDLMKNFGQTLGIMRNAITMTLMTVFFVILWLAESINFQKLLNFTVLKQKHTSIKAFMKIESDLIKFIKVKFVISLGTGIGIGLACVFFGISFPIFWGLFAFLINFVQMIGSVISVVFTALFAFVELDPSSTLLFFILSITAVQVLFGGILEPIFMGQSFAINVITILVMLMLWGFVWGIPGLILAIPITVFLKIILEQFPKTKIIAELLTGSNKKLISLKK